MTTRRVFFGLWPDADTRRAIDRLAGRFDGGGRPTPAANLHVTLVFIGSVDASRLACLKQAAAGVEASPFTIHLDRIGSFHRKALWLGCREIPSPLRQLQQDLSRALTRDCQYQPERRPYVPHVTLQRNIRREISQDIDETLVWPVDSFSLLLSQGSPEGVRYSELTRFGIG